MRLLEIFTLDEQNIINEVAVDSSWIEDIELHHTGKDVIMTLLSGRTYLIPRVPVKLYDLWIEADSPGKFWHNYIAGKYIAKRIG